MNIHDPNLSQGEQVSMLVDYPLDGNAECPNCHREFTPRKGTGGKPQVYCSAECRREADAERKGNAPQREQRAPQRADADLPERPSAPETTSDDAEDTSTEFNWATDTDAVLIPEQRAVAVYWNARDELVIRQERSWADNEDQIIIIHNDSIRVFIDKIDQLHHARRRE